MTSDAIISEYRPALRVKWRKETDKKSGLRADIVKFGTQNE